MLKEVFLGIGSIALPLSGVAIAMDIMGKIGVTTFAKGLADMAIVIGGVSTVIGVIGALASLPYISEFISTGIDITQKVFKGIGSVGTELGITALALVAMGLATPAVMASGLAGFAILVDGVSVVIVSLGALAQIPRIYLASWRRRRITLQSRRDSR